MTSGSMSRATHSPWLMIPSNCSTSFSPSFIISLWIVIASVPGRHCTSVHSARPRFPVVSSKYDTRSVSQVPSSGNAPVPAGADLLTSATCTSSLPKLQEAAVSCHRWLGARVLRSWHASRVSWSTQSSGSSCRSWMLTGGRTALLSSSKSQPPATNTNSSPPILNASELHADVPGMLTRLWYRKRCSPSRILSMKRRFDSAFSAAANTEMLSVVNSAAYVNCPVESLVVCDAYSKPTVMASRSCPRTMVTQPAESE
mmetsp:Transcript_69159/g.144184  ORF Transcript_69159/g.144184 Transcript_69159/m.144184 type:complete len:257 (+) Transcript_69159:610-1380(+)